MCPARADSGANRHDEPLFPTEVLFYHQPVAWVLGETMEAAQRGAARVTAEYEPLPAILTIEQAIDAGSFLTEPLRIVDGDTSAVDASPIRIEGELRIGGQEHFYLETQAALAWIDEAGFIAVHSSTQHPSETQEVVARVLGVPRNHVTVECLRMGGAFGGKEVQANPVCGDRRARRVEDEAPRARQADARARHGDHGKTPSVSREVRGRVFARRPFERRCASSCFPTAAGASTYPSPSCGARCFTWTTRTSCRRSR